MDTALNSALSQPNLEEVLISALEHADGRIRKFVWRGYKPRFSKIGCQVMVGDKTAQDFVNEALKRLCEGRRTYDPARSLVDNLNSITDSLIWSEKKASDRTGIVDFVDNPENNAKGDPISNAVGTERPPDATVVNDEKMETQRRCFNMVRAAFDGDTHVQEYLDALSEGYFDIHEISEITGIPTNRIYEIRRKLKKAAPDLFGVTNYGQLERRINEGN